MLAYGASYIPCPIRLSSPNILTVPDSIITGEPNGLVRQIHTRMPVILPEEHHDAGGVTTVVVVLED
jgi:hypothetical protein